MIAIRLDQDAFTDHIDHNTSANMDFMTQMLRWQNYKTRFSLHGD
jgi:hypothetical protein